MAPIVEPLIKDLVLLYRENSGYVPRHSNAGAEKFMAAAFNLGAQTQHLAERMDAEATRMDIDSYAKAVAITCAIDDANARPTTAPDEALEAKSFVGWQPHTWVIDAIKQAYRDGIKQRDHDNEHVMQAMQDQHEADEVGMVRATVAAVMELNMTNINHLVMPINLESQRTIWDRFDLTQSLDEGEGVVVWTLTRK